MADPKSLQALNIDGLKLEVQKCWEQLGISKLYMLSLLGRDEFTPVLAKEPVSNTFYYTDPASGNNALFHAGQFVVWPDKDSPFDGCGFGIVIKVDMRSDNSPSCVWWLYLEKKLREAAQSGGDVASLRTELERQIADVGKRVDGCVTITGEQTVTGAKTFSNYLRTRSGLMLMHPETTSGVYMTGDVAGGIAFNAHRDWAFTAGLASLSAVGRFSAKQLKSEAAQGVAPVDVGSTTLCGNLNADMVDGLHASSFARADASPAADLNTVNGCGIMSNDANGNATEAHHYPISEAGVLIYGNAAYKSACQIYGTYISNRWFARGGGGADGKTVWREFAFTDSTVASAKSATTATTASSADVAKKLETPRNIWGKPFNGGGDVDGHMRGVADINTPEVPARVVYLGAEHNGNAWGVGKGVVNIAVTDNTNETPLLLAYRKGTTDMAEGNRLFSMELRNTGDWLDFRYGGYQKFSFNSDGTFNAVGDVTCLSDMRFKDVVDNIVLAVEDVAGAPMFVYRSKGTEDARLHAGSSAQYWEGVLPWLVPEREGRKSLSYDKAGLLSAISVARAHVRDVAVLRAENSELKAEVTELRGMVERLMGMMNVKESDER